MVLKGNVTIGLQTQQKVGRFDQLRPETSICTCNEIYGDDTAEPISELIVEVIS